MLLTKTRYMTGLQCQKLLWYTMNKPDVFPEAGQQKLSLFDQGIEVGNYAKLLYDGKNAQGNSFSHSLYLTRELMKQDIPVFEAGIKVNNLYARADILIPGWDLIEVKAGTSVKDINIEDLAFQSHVFSLAGIQLNHIYLMYINRDYVRQGDIDPAQLLVKVDVTERVKEARVGIEERIRNMFVGSSPSKKPDVRIGPQCDDPYQCALKERCWAYLPEDNPTILRKGFQDIYDGVLSVKDVKGDLDHRQRIIVEAHNSGTYVDREGIGEFLSRLKDPLHFLDFETVSGAIPLFDGTRPYQQIPFQFSLHILDGGLTHHSVIASGDPRKEILDKLTQYILPQGSILAYYAPFEINVLNNLAEQFPEHEPWISSTTGRFEDLLRPFKSMHYYNPAQLGSASLKKVYPALTGKTYDTAITNGMDASLLLKNNPDVKTLMELEEYCSLDTRAMIDVLEQLKALTQHS
jgi:hypothetical protein